MKINMNGLYRHKPSYKYCKSDDLTWCKNWTFKPYEYKGEIYMKDTYWNNGSLIIDVDENNIKEFELVFDFNDVEETNCKFIEEFGKENKDWFVVAVDSGGWQFPKTFVKKGAKRDKDLVIARKTEQIESLKKEINNLEMEINLIKNDEIPLSEYI